MKRVLNRVIENGFNEVTIGIGVDSENLKTMYMKWGFSKYIKTKDIDHHNVDELGNPNQVDVPFDLYLATIHNKNRTRGRI